MRILNEKTVTENLLDLTDQEIEERIRKLTKQTTPMIRKAQDRNKTVSGKTFNKILELEFDSANLSIEEIILTAAVSVKEFDESPREWVSQIQDKIRELDERDAIRYMKSNNLFPR